MSIDNDSEFDHELFIKLLQSNHIKYITTYLRKWESIISSAKLIWEYQTN
jgi:hypothetical protein